MANDMQLPIHNVTDTGEIENSSLAFVLFLQQPILKTFKTSFELYAFHNERLPKTNLSDPRQRVPLSSIGFKYEHIKKRITSQQKKYEHFKQVCCTVFVSPQGKLRGGTY